MGRIIQQNNGKTTVYVTGENLSSLSATTNTYFVGVDLNTGIFEKKNPNGSIINLEGGTGGTTFTGGTVTGATNFTNGLEANVISATTYLNLPVTQFTGGTVNGATNFSNGLTANTLSSSSVACSGALSAGSLSATTYLNLPADIYITGGTYSAGTLTLSRTVLSNIVVTGFTNNAIVTTYSQLVSDILLSELMPGAFYLISDYQTCYDQPDYDYDNNPITTGNYKQGPVVPLMVLATSVNTISSDAYQPAYPNDKIRYDWTFSATEVTNSVAFGRITERVDEFNNRTDYDHREVLFRRYDNYYYKEKDIAKGTIELIENTGEVIGTDTEFLNYNIGDYIAIPNSNVTFFEIISISGDTSMVVSGLTIPAVSAGSSFYSAQSDGLTYKQNNISIQYTEHPTFLFDSETIISNYIGDVSTFIDWGENTFLLGNNVFGEDVTGNRIGNDFRNNTFDSDVEHNVIGDQFENNTIVNDEDFTDNQIAANFRNNLIICGDFNDNVIGDNFNNNKFFNNNNSIVDNQIGVGFNNNTIYDSFEDNKIGNGFEDNVIDGSFVNNSIRNQFDNNEIFSQFYENLIGDYFNNNTIYSDFYKNEILVDFNNNEIGDLGNLNEFNFYRNYIRNNFNRNIIRQDFQNNQIGTNYQQNEINGEFIGNTILNGFNNNTIGSDFGTNNIGNAFNNNIIHDEFNQNTTDYYFYNNIISNEFENNTIGSDFENNRPFNSNLFGWNDLSTVSIRTYDNFRDVVGGGNLGNRLLGKELVMRVISTSQYFRIKFTQWTQDGNGGGFQYERQELDSNGGSIGPFVTFKKTNYSDEVDIIIPGVLHITRGDNGGIYNVVTESSWNGSVSPGDTEWNSIYTQSNNGERFTHNKIGNNFRDNIIGSYFGYDDDDEDVKGNEIGDNFIDNTVASPMYSNVIANDFNENTIYSFFYYNTISDNFSNNVIGDIGNLNEFNFGRNHIGVNFDSNIIRQEFRNNQINNNFYLNEINGEFRGNTILNEFQSNSIGYIFNDNLISNGFESNTIYDDSYRNTIKNNFRQNIISNYFNTNDLGDYFEDNRPSNWRLFGWDDLSTVSTRTYDRFRDIVGGGQLGHRLLGKELVMRVISTSQYFKIKFTQWTQNANGGGFQYEREEIDSNGNSVGPNIAFTKTNNGSEIDVIIPGVLEITRGNNGGIYNTITEGSWNGSVSPGDTEWNSIYTQLNNGERFAYNKIGNNFMNNEIGSDFGYGGGAPYGNLILDDFQRNIIGQYAYNNVIGNRFTENTIGDNFENNTIKNYFENNFIGDIFESNISGDYFRSNNIGNDFTKNTIKNYFVGNTILDGFESNEIGDYFGNDTSGPGSPIQNIIFNDFKYNKIGNFFGNDTNYPSVGNGTNGDGGNIINDGFQFNVIGDNVIYNAIDLNFTNNKIGNDFWFNSFDPNTSDNVIGNLFVGNSGFGGVFTPIGSGFISNTIGNYAAFNLIDTNFQFNKIGNFFGNASFNNQNQIADGFRNNNIGDYFGDDGSQTSGGNVINFEFYDNLIGNKFYNNTTDAEFYRNDIGNEFFNNTLNGGSGNIFHNNEIGNRFNNNTTNGRFYGNVIGGGFNNNNVGDNFYINEIGFGFNNNSIDESFGSNFIGYYFYNNNIGRNFYNNRITTDSFQRNTVGDDFRYNTVEFGVNNFNFTTGPATHVYGGYNCTIFGRQDGTPRLSYYDSTDVLNITNIDA